MNRRDVLRLISLSAGAVAGGPLLAGCAAHQPGRRAAPVTDGVVPVRADVDRAPVDGATVPAVVDALHRSGGALFGRLAESPGNLALSPYSIAVALAMTANGAAGETRRQLEQAIGGLPVDDANRGLGTLTRHIESLAGTRRRVDGTTSRIRVDSANALFGQRGVRWERPLLRSLAEHYGADLNTVDFLGATEAARVAVNAWTADRTNDKIPEILPPDSVGAATRLVLVNALYLKAPWEVPFEESLTEDRDFHLLDGSIVEVPMMSGSGPVAPGAATGPGWRSVRLPYAGRELAMTVVLPDSDRYDEVEADVVAGNLGSYLELPGRGALAVEVVLPRWTFRTGASLKQPLIELGVDAPFDSADLTPMTDDDLDLYVDEVFHQVYVAVDEGGTEAAAATAVVGNETVSMPITSDVVVVDRPFLFVVHDVAHGTPLFVGRVLDTRG